MFYLKVSGLSWIKYEQKSILVLLDSFGGSLEIVSQELSGNAFIGILDHLGLDLTFIKKSVVLVQPKIGSSINMVIVRIARGFPKDDIQLMKSQLPRFGLVDQSSLSTIRSVFWRRRMSRAEVRLRSKGFNDLFKVTRSKLGLILIYMKQY